MLTLERESRVVAGIYFIRQIRRSGHANVGILKTCPTVLNVEFPITLKQLSAVLMNLLERFRRFEINVPFRRHSTPNHMPEENTIASLPSGAVNAAPKTLGYKEIDKQIEKLRRSAVIKGHIKTTEPVGSHWRPRQAFLDSIFVRPTVLYSGAKETL